MSLGEHRLAVGVDPHNHGHPVVDGGNTGDVGSRPYGFHPRYPLRSRNVNVDYSAVSHG